MSSATRTWASCEIIGGIRFLFTLLFTSSLGESERGGEHPGDFTKSGFDAEGTPTFGPGRARMEPHAMRTCAGTRLNHESKQHGTCVIVSFGMSSFENPSKMLMKMCESPRSRFTLLFSYHTCGSFVVGLTDTTIPRRTGRLRRMSWKATPTSRVPSKLVTTN